MSDLAVLPQAIETVLLDGDLNQLKPEQRLEYYKAVCDSVGLNPLTQPFAYIKLNGKLKLYALKGATDQIRKVHGVSITKLEHQETEGAYIVTAYARDLTGMEDSDIGVVSIANLKGDNLANAMMKAVTKAKRRVTLSMCGLGMLDETEVDSIPNAEVYKAELKSPSPKDKYQEGITQDHRKQLNEIASACDVDKSNAITLIAWLSGSDIVTHQQITPEIVEKAHAAYKDCMDAKMDICKAFKEFLATDENAESVLG